MIVLIVSTYRHLGLCRYGITIRVIARPIRHHVLSAIRYRRRSHRYNSQ